MYQTSSSTSSVCTITNCLVVILLIRLANELVVSSNFTWYLVKLPNVLVILWTVNLLVYLVTTTSYFFQCNVINFSMETHAFCQICTSKTKLE